MGPKTKSAHLLRWHYGDRVTVGQFSNSFPKHFSYLCECAFRFDLSCTFCEYPFIFHCLHCSPSCFDPDSLLLAYLWLGLSWIDCVSANKSFSSPKTSSRKPYTSSKQQERQKHSVETTINFSQGLSSKIEWNPPVYSRWIGSMAKDIDLVQFAYSTLGSRRTCAIYHSLSSPVGNPLRMDSRMV